MDAEEKSQTCLCSQYIWGICPHQVLCPHMLQKTSDLPSDSGSLYLMSQCGMMVYVLSQIILITIFWCGRPMYPAPFIANGSPVLHGLEHSDCLAVCHVVLSFS